jgi:hypothetical protein
MAEPSLPEVFGTGIQLQIGELLKQPPRGDTFEELDLSRQLPRSHTERQVHVVNHRSTCSQVDPFVCGDSFQELTRLNLDISYEKSPPPLGREPDVEESRHVFEAAQFIARSHFIPRRKGVDHSEAI